MNNEFPDLQSFIEYIEKFYSLTNDKRKGLKKTYLDVVNRFDKPVRFLESIQKDYKYDDYNSCIAMFLTLKCKVFIFEFVHKIRPYRLKEKVIYYGIVDKRLDEICEEEFKSNKNMRRDFFKYLIKTFAYFNVKEFSEIEVERIGELNTDSFTTDRQRRRQYILFLDKVIGLYFLQGNKRNIRDEINVQSN